MNIIRKHYNRPEFIPDDSESSSLDWIFVGGHGKGAQMHVSLIMFSSAEVISAPSQDSLARSQDKNF